MIGLPTEVGFPLEIVHGEDIFLSYFADLHAVLVEFNSLHGLLLQVTRLNLG